MKVVIDTNVVVSAAIRDRGPERVVLFVVETPGFEWVATSEILQEYREVLARPKFALPPALVDQWTRVLREVTTLVEVDRTVEFPRDPADAKFIQCALASEADFFVTGDRDFGEARRILTTTVLSVASFERNVCKVWGLRFEARSAGRARAIRLAVLMDETDGTPGQVGKGLRTVGREVRCARHIMRKRDGSGSLPASVGLSRSFIGVARDDLRPPSEPEGVESFPSP